MQEEMQLKQSEKTFNGEPFCLEFQEEWCGGEEHIRNSCFVLDLLDAIENNKMKVRFKRCHPDAVIPTKAHPTDAGFDLVCTRMEIDTVKEIITYHTDIALEIPKGYVGLLFPRSSVYKVQLQLSNSVGVVDSGYRGELSFKYRIVQPHIFDYNVGDRVGQLIIIPYPEIEFEEVEELSASDRGENGYGSTGK